MLSEATNLAGDSHPRAVLPLVSVIMPSYNAGHFLRRSVASVLGQSFHDWELLIVDDCSTDNSAEVGEQLAAGDSRIRHHRLTKNSGAAVARNTAIEMAAGRFIAFLDADDVWHTDKLRQQILMMQATGAVLTHTYYGMIDEQDQAVGGVRVAPSRVDYSELLKSNRIGCLTAVYDSQPWGKFYMPLIRKRQDYGLWLSILKRESHAYCIPQVLASYRVRPGSISSNKLEMIKYNWSLYRDIEKLSRVRAGYYLMWNIYRKVSK